ncbi:MAG: glycoside hydrolase family 95 protein, partial [Muribaculaceae bacterium]|nr:glycoside hydrolase family 95 protein [Muribaculaceae bacterium]
MKLKTVIITACTFASALTAGAKQSEAIMWYQSPAKEWIEAVPLGNGRIGAMVYGGIDRERVALNEITLWAGQRDS